MARSNGTIRMYSVARGFGFITDGGGEGDYFFHVSRIRSGNPVEGASATFDLEDDPRGRGIRAVEVEIGTR
jgi:cold shock CspA family protein